MTNSLPSAFYRFVKVLNLLIDARMVSKTPHGIGRYTVNLVQELSELGHNVTILSHSDESVKAIGRSHVHDWIPVRSPFVSFTEPFELSLKCYRKSFDVVHFPSFASPLNVPPRSVFTIHDMIHLHPPWKWHHQLYYRTVVKHALSKAPRVIAVSEWTKKEIHSYLGTPLSKIDVIRNGLSTEWFEEAKKKSDRPLKKPFFMCLSNPKAHKNVRTLIEACKRIWTWDDQDFYLVLSLGGADFPAEWKITKKERDRIVLLKGTGDEKMKRYMKHAHAMIGPSHLEGFDYPVAEALVLGQRVILSKGSSHNEFSGDKLIFYGKPDNVSGLIAALRETLKQKAEASPFSVHNVRTRRQMAEDTVKVYHKVIAKD